MRPATWSRPRPTMARTLSASAAASSLAMAPGGQGPPVGRDPARQLVPGPSQGALDLEERQAARGCTARLVRTRPGALLVTPSRALPKAATSRFLRHPLHHLRHPALRGAGRKKSRVDQIVDWLGADFDGVILFDESHAMANAAGSKGERAVTRRPRSRAGRACACSTSCPMPAWSMSRPRVPRRSTTSPMRSGSAFGVGKISPSHPRGIRRGHRGGRRRRDGGPRPRPAVARPLHRPVAFLDGVEYEMLEHALTPEQRGIYDAYAGAFAIIHNNLAPRWRRPTSR